MRSLAILTVLALAWTASSCGDSGPAAPPPRPPPSTPPATPPSAPPKTPEPSPQPDPDPSPPRAEASDARVVADPSIPAGTIRGTILFEGEPPPRRPLPVAGTSGCESHDLEQMTEGVIVTDGKLANVFVNVDSGLAPDAIPPLGDAALSLDQHACVYRPHVLGVRVGQKLLVRNLDTVSHNVNTRSRRPSNPSFNRTQSPGGFPIEIVFGEAERSVAVGCDLHPWMGAIVHAVESPFFAVSGLDGAFEIGSLPPGRYRLEAVHEWAGRKSFEVELDSASGAAVELSFSAPKPKSGRR